MHDHHLQAAYDIPKLDNLFIETVADTEEVEVHEVNRDGTTATTDADAPTEEKKEEVAVGVEGIKATSDTGATPPQTATDKANNNNNNRARAAGHLHVQLPSTLKSERLICGHSSGELWGLASHPIAPYFFTAGDDRTVRMWSLESNTLVSYVKLIHMAFMAPV